MKVILKFYSVYADNDRIVDFLIKHGADVNQGRQYSGMTVLMLASMLGNLTSRSYNRCSKRQLHASDISMGLKTIDCFTRLGPQTIYMFYSFNHSLFGFEKEMERLWIY